MYSHRLPYLLKMVAQTSLRNDGPREQFPAWPPPLMLSIILQHLTAPNAPPQAFLAAALRAARPQLLERLVWRSSAPLGRVGPLPTLKLYPLLSVSFGGASRSPQ